MNHQTTALAAGQPRMLAALLAFAMVLALGEIGLPRGKLAADLAFFDMESS